MEFGGGKIEGRNISFYTQQTVLVGKEWKSYKDLFYGTVSNG